MQAGNRAAAAVEHPTVVVGDEPAAYAERAGADRDRVVGALLERREARVRPGGVAEVAVLRALTAVEVRVAAQRSATS